MNDEQRANELYWNSPQSVNSIADELGLSKGRLYSAVRPLPSGRRCPSCGSVLVFENRTARDRGTAVCLSCESEAGSPMLASADGASPESALAPNTVRSAWDSIPITTRILAGAAIGGAVGLFVTRWLRR